MAYRLTALQVFAATRVRFRTPEHMGEKKRLRATTAEGVSVLYYPFFEGFKCWGGIPENVFRKSIRASVRSVSLRTAIGRLRPAKNGGF